MCVSQLFYLGVLEPKLRSYYIKKSEQLYSEHYIPLSQHPVHLMMAG
jgi:hypothetical protein